MKTIRVTTLIALLVVTLGLYLPIWYVRRARELNQLNSNHKLSMPVLYFGLLATSLALLGNLINALIEPSFIQEVIPGQVILWASFANGLWEFVSPFFFLIQALTARWILVDHFTHIQGRRPRMSVLGFVMFQILYLQYWNNRRVDEVPDAGFASA